MTRRLTINSFSRLIRGLRQDVFGRFKTGIWVITALQLCTSAGFSISLPFLALYLYQERGLSMTLVGIIFLIGGLCSAVTQMVGGVLSDRFGRRLLLLGSAGISIPFYSGLAGPDWGFSPGVGYRSCLHRRTVIADDDASGLFSNSG